MPLTGYSFKGPYRSAIKFNLILIAFTFLLTGGCNGPSSIRSDNKYGNSFLDRCLNDPSDYFYFDFSGNDPISSDLPIGMFDSGTGGLTVMNALIKFDRYINQTSQFIMEGDGIGDLKTEHFIYFGDQANMPYGNYSEAKRTKFLEELVLRDALFLLGNKYYRSEKDRKYRTGKESVKMIVIACNTATAYGKDDIEKMLTDAGSTIKVIGVIDAGVRGALSTFEKDESGTVAVMATAGTVSSDGYLNTFRSLKTEMGYSGKIDFIQYPGIGIAEAVDEEPGFIVRGASKTRKEYRGPTFDNDNLKIRKELMGIYNFDTLQNAILCDRQNGECSLMQINSPENYIKYHLVSLCEKLRQMPDVKPLKTLILGCTHYPFLTDQIEVTLKELYDLSLQGKYLYRNVLSDSIVIIDPAVNTAAEVYEYLASNDLLNKTGDNRRSEFYISVPDRYGNKIKTDSLGRFTYDYKYSRDAGHFYDTKQVPFSRLNTSNEIITRFQEQIPDVFDLISRFNSDNDKTTFLKPEERF